MATGSRQKVNEKEWRRVVGHPNYAVSSLGEIYSIPRTDSLGRLQGGAMLALTPRSKKGYLCVQLDGKIRAVHHLVLEAFIGPAPEGMLARHLNDIPTDNSLLNLAWGTVQQNAEDRRRNGNYQHKTQCIRGHPYTPENTWRTKEGYQQCRECHRERERERKRKKVQGSRLQAG